MSKNDVTTMLRDRKLITMMPNGQRAQVIWAKPYTKNIYEMSIQFMDEPYRDGYQLWFVAIEDNKFKFICCSHAGGLEAQAIKLVKEEEDGTRED